MRLRAGSRLTHHWSRQQAMLVVRKVWSLIVTNQKSEPSSSPRIDRSAAVRSVSVSHLMPTTTRNQSGWLQQPCPSTIVVSDKKRTKAGIITHSGTGGCWETETPATHRTEHERNSLSCLTQSARRRKTTGTTAS